MTFEVKWEMKELLSVEFYWKNQAPGVSILDLNSKRVFSSFFFQSESWFLWFGTNRTNKTPLLYIDQSINSDFQIAIKLIMWQTILFYSIVFGILHWCRYLYQIYKFNFDLLIGGENFWCLFFRKKMMLFFKRRW